MADAAEPIEKCLAIAYELSQLWGGRAVSEDMVWRYIHAEQDPLPAVNVRGRILVDRAALKAWAERQVRRLAPPPREDRQLGLDLPAPVSRESR